MADVTLTVRRRMASGGLPGAGRRRLDVPARCRWWHAAAGFACTFAAAWRSVLLTAELRFRFREAGVAVIRPKWALGRRKLGSPCGVLGLVSMALLSSCTPGPNAIATINYREVSVCTDNNDTAGSDFLIVLVFEITSIDNTGSNASSFAFNPNLLYVNGQNGHDFAATSYGAPGDQGISLNGAPFGFAQPQTVPAGSTVPVNAGVVVTDTVDAGGSDIRNANTIDFHLLYSSADGTEGALPVKTEQAKYPTVNSWAVRTMSDASGRAGGGAARRRQRVHSRHPLPALPAVGPCRHRPRVRRPEAEPGQHYPRDRHLRALPAPDLPRQRPDPDAAGQGNPPGSLCWLTRGRVIRAGSCRGRC